VLGAASDPPKYRSDFVSSGECAGYAGKK